MGSPLPDQLNRLAWPSLAKKRKKKLLDLKDLKSQEPTMGQQLRPGLRAQGNSLDGPDGSSMWFHNPIFCF